MDKARVFQLPGPVRPEKELGQTGNIHENRWIIKRIEKGYPFFIKMHLHEHRIEGHLLVPDSNDEFPTYKAIRNGKTLQDLGRVHNPSHHKRDHPGRQLLTGEPQVQQVITGTKIGKLLKGSVKSLEITQKLQLGSRGKRHQFLDGYDSFPFLIEGITTGFLRF